MGNLCGIYTNQLVSSCRRQDVEPSRHVNKVTTGRNSRHKLRFQVILSAYIIFQVKRSSVHRSINTTSKFLRTVVTQTNAKRSVSPLMLSKHRSRDSTVHKSPFTGKYRSHSVHASTVQVLRTTPYTTLFRAGVLSFTYATAFLGA